MCDSLDLRRLTLRHPLNIKRQPSRYLTAQGKVFRVIVCEAAKHP
jgi:hypothetical protein